MCRDSEKRTTSIHPFHLKTGVLPSQNINAAISQLIYKPLISKTIVVNVKIYKTTDVFMFACYVNKKYKPDFLFPISASFKFILDK